MSDSLRFFSKEPVSIEDDMYIFSVMQEKEDYWLTENFELHEEDRLVEFLPDEHYELALEVGAGNGRCTAPLSRVCTQLFALESSMTGITQLKSRKLSNVENVLNYDIELPFKDNLFDLVVSITVIEHISPEIAIAFLKEHFRVLKPGGVFLIRNDAWFYRVLEHVGYFDKDKPDPTHVNMVTPRRLRQQLEKTGFDVEHEAYFPFYHFTKKVFPMMDILATKGNFVCRKPCND